MRKLLVLALCLLPLSAFAQFSSNTARRVVSGTAAPPALCNASPVDMYARTGATSPGLYVCLTTNTWTGPLTSGGGGTTINPTNNVLPKRSNSTTFADSSLTDNGTTVTGTEQYVGPLLTGPTYSMVGQTAQGFGDDATVWGPGAPTIWGAANSRLAVFFSGLTIPTGSCYYWASSNINFNASRDTCLSRAGVGVVSFDNGAGGGNGLGSSTNCRTVVNVTPVTVNANVSTDQTLMAFTLPANCLNTVGRTLRIFVAGVYSTAATSTAQMTLKVKICSVSGCGSGNVASVISIQSAALGTLTITNNAWNGTFYVTTQTASTAGAWEAHGAFGIDEGALATAADSFFNDSNTATVTGSPSAIDTTAQNFLQITFAFSAASTSNSVTQRQLVIDSVN